MKLLIIFFFIASIKIFGMEQKDEALIPLEPLFGGSFLVDELNLPELAREESISKDGFYSLPETPLASSSSGANDEQEVLKARGSNVIKVARHFPVHDTNILRVKKRIPGRGTFYNYQKLMLDEIAQDEKRLKQEAKEIGKEKKSLQEIYTNQNENSLRTIKRTGRGLKVKDIENKFTDSEFAELRRLLKPTLIDQVPEKRVIATATVRVQCTKCKNFFFKLDMHLKKSSCGK